MQKITKIDWTCQTEKSRWVATVNGRSIIVQVYNYIFEAYVDNETVAYGYGFHQIEPTILKYLNANV
jgi:hypothetical protein